MKNADACAMTLSRRLARGIISLMVMMAGIAIVFYHFSDHRPRVTLITESAEGIKAGKTPIKNRSIIIGEVESTALADDLRHVEINVRLNRGMEKLLHSNSVFWRVKRNQARTALPA